MSSSFEEAEFGSRKVVPDPSKKEGGGGRRKAEEGRGKKAAKRSKNRKGGKKPAAGSRNPKKQRVAKGEAAVETSGSGVLVPLDQWTRVLNQLGNLHEAGQQIAEARERAAKAETEAAFLRERMRELRAELEVYKRTQGD